MLKHIYKLEKFFCFFSADKERFFSWESFILPIALDLSRFFWVISEKFCEVWGYYEWFAFLVVMADLWGYDMVFYLRGRGLAICKILYFFYILTKLVSSLFVGIWIQQFCKTHCLNLNFLTRGKKPSFSNFDRWNFLNCQTPFLKQFKKKRGKIGSKGKPLIANQ